MYSYSICEANSVTGSFGHVELKYWFIIGGAVVLGLGGAIFGMIHVNTGNAIAQCEKAGYMAPERTSSITTCPADTDYGFSKVAIVAGNVQGSPTPALTDESKKYVQNSYALENGDLDLYVYSATPSNAKISVASKKVKKSQNLKTFIKNTDKKIESINEALATPSTEDGADYFNTIMTAASATKSPSGDDSLVLVTGSGLSDAQPLNFAGADILHAEPKDILEGLQESEVVEPGMLNGVTIVWSGLGITALPQQPLDAKEKRNLQKIYSTLFNYAGATFIADDTVMTSDGVETDYKVNPTKVTGVSGGVVVYRLGENSVGFVPDTATIKDAEKANTAVSGIVNSWTQCKSSKLTIEGYQARPNGEVEETSKLSQDRANALKTLLVGKGVSADAVTAIGKGSSNFEGRIDENGTNGEWDTNRAQSNRIVLVKLQGGGGCNG